MAYRKYENLQKTQALRIEQFCPYVGRGTEFTYSGSKIEEHTPKPIEHADWSQVPCCTALSPASNHIMCYFNSREA